MLLPLVIYGYLALLASTEWKIDVSIAQLAFIVAVVEWVRSVGKHQHPRPSVCCGVDDQVDEIERYEGAQSTA